MIEVTDKTDTIRLNYAITTIIINELLRYFRRNKQLNNYIKQ